MEESHYLKIPESEKLHSTKIFKKLQASNYNLKKKRFIDFLCHRGGFSEPDSLYIWNLVTKDKSEEIDYKMGLPEFQIAMRYCSASQLGLDIRTFKIESVESLPLVKFQKQENLKHGKMKEPQDLKSHFIQKGNELPNSKGDETQILIENENENINEQIEEDIVAESMSKIKIEQSPLQDTKLYEEYDRELSNIFFNQKSRTISSKESKRSNNSESNNKPILINNDEIGENPELKTFVSDLKLSPRGENSIPSDLIGKNENFEEDKENGKDNLKIISIVISNYRVIRESYLSKSYALYQVKTTFLNFENLEVSIEVERRFSDFEWLVNYINNQPKFQGVLCPRLPEKENVSSFIKNYVGSNYNQYQRRQYDLEKFLQEISSSIKFQNQDFFMKFLNLESDEFRIYKKTQKITNGENGTSIFEVKMDFQHMIDYAQAYVKTQFNDISGIGDAKKEFVRIFIDEKELQKISSYMEVISAKEEIIHQILQNFEKNLENFKVIGNSKS